MIKLFKEKEPVKKKKMTPKVVLWQYIENEDRTDHEIDSLIKAANMVGKALGIVTPMQYVVKQVSHTIYPRIGQVMTEREVQRLLDQGMGIHFKSPPVARKKKKDLP